MQRKPPAQRAFHGLAGRDSTPQPAKTNAQRQKEFRQRQQEKKAEAAMMRAVAGVMKEHPDDLGRRLTGTPHRKGAGGMQVNVKNITKVIEAVDHEIQQFGGPNGERPLEYHETTTGRREVKPEGISEFPDVKIGNNGNILQTRTSRFRVKLGGQFDGIISNLVDEHFDDLGPIFRCDCGFETSWPRERAPHIAENHGEQVRAIAEEKEEEDRKYRRAARKQTALAKELQQMQQREQSIKEGHTKPVTGEGSRK